jgi:ABC-type transport system substrate-binding protein
VPEHRARALQPVRGRAGDREHAARRVPGAAGPDVRARARRPEPLWTGIYTCGAASNYTGYCSPSVDDLLVAADAELNANRRAADLNAADAALAADVPVLPLYQRPLVVAHGAALHGVVANASVMGALWNLADWWKA